MRLTLSGICGHALSHVAMPFKPGRVELQAEPHPSMSDMHNTKESSEREFASLQVTISAKSSKAGQMLFSHVSANRNTCDKGIVARLRLTRYGRLS